MKEIPKQEIIHEAAKGAAKLLGLAFKVCKLKEKIETMVVDEDTGEEYVLTFYPVHKFLKSENKINGQGSASLRIDDDGDSNAPGSGNDNQEDKSLGIGLYMHRLRYENGVYTLLCLCMGGLTR